MPAVGDVVLSTPDEWMVLPARYRKLYPRAVACQEDDVASLTVHLRFPREHWKRIRHSNFIERTFGESRRRVEVIGRLPGEATCLSLVGRARSGQPRLARRHPDIGDHPPAARPPPPAP